MHNIQRCSENAEQGPQSLLQGSNCPLLDGYLSEHHIGAVAAFHDSTLKLSITCYHGSLTRGDQNPFSLLEVAVTLLQ
jgi:hypothetical protein